MCAGDVRDQCVAFRFELVAYFYLEILFRVYCQFRLCDNLRTLVICFRFSFLWLKI